jgi:hypothetical protein
MDIDRFWHVVWNVVEVGILRGQSQRKVRHYKGYVKKVFRPIAETPHLCDKSTHTTSV